AWFARAGGLTSIVLRSNKRPDPRRRAAIAEHCQETKKKRNHEARHPRRPRRLRRGVRPVDAARTVLDGPQRRVDGPQGLPRRGGGVRLRGGPPGRQRGHHGTGEGVGSHGSVSVVLPRRWNRDAGASFSVVRRRVRSLPPALRGDRSRSCLARRDHPPLTAPVAPLRTKTENRRDARTAGRPAPPPPTPRPPARPGTPTPAPR
ncbi:hypothetical protein ACHAWF_013543, partial [Thalassiosira exigua]